VSLLLGHLAFYFTLDISDLNNGDFDELLIEQKAHVIWIHFAVKPDHGGRFY